MSSNTTTTGHDPPTADKCRARLLWMQKNLLPYEVEIRSWLQRSRVGDSEIDDIIQEMYARIGDIEDLESIGSPRIYAYQVAKAIHHNLARRKHVVSVTPDGNLEKLEIPSSDASPEDKLALRDELARVISVIAGLPKRTRDVLLMRRVAGLSQRETAAKLAVSEKTVERHLAQAVVTLMNKFGRGIRHRNHMAAGGCDDNEELDSQRDRPDRS